LPSADESHEASAAPFGPLLVSVVIPTKDRPEALSSCLDALAAQTIADRLEAIVVDDGSLAGDEVGAVVRRHGRARLIPSPGNGPAAARNSGAQNAQGRFLCFTDDDCVPHADWAERLVEALQRGADAVAGRTLSGMGALAEASELVAQAPAAAPSEGDDLAFAPSNNLACTRAAFAATLFDDSYPDAAGEDRDWCARLRAAGYVLRSEPAACLVHRQSLTFSGFLRQQLRYGQGAFRFRHGGGEHRPLEDAGFYASLVRRAFMQGFNVGLLVCAAQAVTAAGFIGAWTMSRRDAADIMPASERNGR
jgi:glycosyltransferase involved in cell wall biosynthesis